jgi:ornithine cyclodeaminase/alanine dehydrogenase-like protein (mu-crystallin family)
MALRILSNRHVTDLLVNFTPADATRMADKLFQTFYNLLLEGDDAKQPHRTVASGAEGQTLIFMPAILNDGVSVKIVGAPAPSAPGAPPLRGALVICDENGACIGLMNSSEFTGFRTALGSMLLYQQRKETANIVVFGAGKQALWHLRLALVLRGKDIKAVTIVNRSAKRAEQVVDQLRQMDVDSSTATTHSVDFAVIDNESSPDYDAKLRSAIEASDVIFCTTPSKQPLFPAEWLASDAGRAKTRYIAAIGSYKLDMQEIDPEYVKHVVASGGGPPSRAQSGSVIVVDNRAACKVEAGELDKAGLADEQMMEAADIVHQRKTGTEEDKAALESWIESGLVIYKSVGVGVMDLALGKELLSIAAEKNVGQSMDEF